MEGPTSPTVDHYRAEVRIGPLDTASAAFDRVRDRLFSYAIFPSWLIHYASCPPGPIAEGTTIVQRVVFGPTALEMAVRVIAVWNREQRSLAEAGFTYATVAGHAECGVATFQVRRDEGQRVTVYIEARSRPGTHLTRLGRPVARLFQRTLTRVALHRLASAGGSGGS